jgi:Domain of unknown function (DUF4192)
MSWTSTTKDIVAAAAALLGFAPTDSIVAYMLHRDHNTGDMVVRIAIRFDVTITVDQAGNFPATCNLRPENNHAAVLLAVCDQPHDWHALTILDALRVALHTAGILVLRRIMTRDVTTTPTPTHSSPPTESSAVTESARDAATSKPNSPTCRQPHRWPSVTTANSSSPPPRRSPTPSQGTQPAAPCPSEL